jgi:hypothetical protein
MEGADVLAYVAGAVLVLWGAAHIAPTRSVVESFGAISADNRRIRVMEWVAEGFTHIFIGGLVILVAALEGSSALGVGGGVCSVSRGSFPVRGLDRGYRGSHAGDLVSDLSVRADVRGAAPGCRDLCLADV